MESNENLSFNSRIFLGNYRDGPTILSLTRDGICLTLPMPGLPLNVDKIGNEFGECVPQKLQVSSSVHNSIKL